MWMAKNQPIESLKHQRLGDGASRRLEIAFSEPNLFSQLSPLAQIQCRGCQDILTRYHNLIYCSLEINRKHSKHLRRNKTGGCR